MAQQTMYDGAVNSPITTITNNISSTDTTIYVLDDTKIPDAPNLLVIGGNSQGAETVLMTSKNVGELTVQRGFQGAAVAWNAGATIARNFTEYDYRTLKENVEDLAGREALDLLYDNTTSGLAATQVQAAIDEVDGDLDAHKAESVSLTGGFTRDGTLGGTQKIITGFRPKAINIIAIVPNIEGLMSIGFADNDLHNGVVYDASYSAAGRYDNSLTRCIYIRKTSADFLYGTITLIENDGFTISWVKGGLGVTGTINCIYLVTTH